MFASAITLVYAAVLRVELNPLKAYSWEQTFRLQTEAFFEGRVALGMTPEAVAADYAWGHGVQQVWGLGVPLLRLPFEGFFRLLSAGPFPDRFVILLLVLVTACLICHICVTRLTLPAPDLAGSLPRLLLAAWVLLLPALLSCASPRFGQYEEAVFVGQYWLLLAAGFSLCAWQSHRLSIWLIAFCILGFAPFIRPTTIFFTGPLWLVSLYFLKQSPFRTVTSFALAAVLPVLSGALLVSNYLRFGHAFEFGHALSRTGVRLAYRIRAADFVDRGTFVERVGELVGVFLNTTFNQGYFYLRDFFWLQADTYRFRQFYMTVYSKPFLLLVCLCIFCAAGQVVRRWQRRGATQFFTPISAVRISCLLAISGLSIFYIETPVITSRYLVDFSAVFGLLIVTTVLPVVSSVRRNPVVSSILPVLLLLLSAYDMRNVQRAHPLGRKVRGSATRGYIQGGHEVSRRKLEGAVFGAYRCDRSGREGVASSRVTGWDISSDCQANAITFLYLPFTPCVALTYQPVSHDGRFWEQVTDPQGLPMPRVLAGRIRWSLSQRQIDSATGIYRDTFCGPSQSRAVNAQLINIVWQNRPEPPYMAAPIRLFSVRAVEGD